MSQRSPAVDGPSMTPLTNPFLRAFFRSPSGTISVILISILIADVLVAPSLLGGRAGTISIPDNNQGPTLQHWLGTDQLGRDIFARTLIAARTSVVIALGAASISVLLGGTIGLANAVSGPRMRSLLERVVDSMIAFPAVITIILISTTIGTGVVGAVIGVGFAGSFRFARLVTTLSLSIGGRDFVKAARILGVRRSRIMFRHLLPNIAEPLIVSLSFIVTFGLVVNAGLSFLGLGVQPPQYDWGLMLTAGVQALYLNPALALSPAAALALAALSIGFFGESVARATNPRLWTGGQAIERIAHPDAAAGLPAIDLTDDPAANQPTPTLVVERSRWQPDGAGDPRSAELVLSVRELTVAFPGPTGPVEVVKGVTLSVAAGEVLGVVGESGSGKTMTMLGIARKPPYRASVTGTVRLHGQDLSAVRGRALDRLLGKQLGFVFQDPTSSLNPALTIGRHLTERATVHQGLSRAEATALAVARLREVSLPAPASQMERYPHELSGGMRQRAVIAMSLMNQPSLLICDEPTTALDVTIQAQIMDLLQEVNQRHRTAIVLVSHNLALVAQNCDRVLVMYAGRIVEDLDSDQLFSTPRHPYTKALLGAVPNAGQLRSRPLVSIPGESPDLASLPTGCPFHPRCPLAVDRCRSERPPLVRESDGRRLACWVTSEVAPDSKLTEHRA